MDLDLVDLGLCCIPLGPGTGDTGEGSVSLLCCCSSGGTGDDTQLAVMGLTTDRSSSDDLGLGVSARVKVFRAMDIGVKLLD